MVSVVETPNFLNLYTDVSSLDSFYNVSVKNVVAFADELTGLASDLTLGGSSNVNIEAIRDVRLFTAEDIGQVRMFNTSYDSNTDIRTDDEILNVYQDVALNRTFITSGTGSNQLCIKGTDNYMTAIIGTLKIQTPQYGHVTVETLSSAQSNITFRNDILFDSNVDVAGDAVFQNNAFIAGSLFAYGNLFGTNMNLIKDKDSNVSGLDQVGYGFRINTDDQLELIKYAKYVPEGVEALPGDRISKRVAVFGNSTPARGSASDSNASSYLVFDEWSGTYVAQQTQSALGTQIKSRYMWRFNSNMDIYSVGTRIGVGVEFPTAELEVNGTLKATTLSLENISTSNVVCNTITTTSITAFDITASNIVGQSVQTTSDVRLKTILPETLTSDVCLDKIKQLDLIKYRFNSASPTSLPNSGFSAQQVKSIIEEAVSLKPVGDLPDCHVIDQVTLIAYLVGSVQELARRLV